MPGSPTESKPLGAAVAQGVGIITFTPRPADTLHKRIALRPLFAVGQLLPLRPV